MTNQTEIAGNNGHYAPCTAQELIRWIGALENSDKFGEGKLCWPEHAGKCLNACKLYLEWYNGSNQT